MFKKGVLVKKYVMRLDGNEREHLEGIIRKGKNDAGRLMKARVLLKADVSDAGEGWSDSRIIEALDASRRWFIGFASSWSKKVSRPS
jgi:hypothetical protein